MLRKYTLTFVLAVLYAMAFFVFADVRAATSTVPLSNVLDLCNKSNAVSIPDNAHYLPLKNADQLQAALDQYHIVRLAPLSDYSMKNPSASITLSSGQELYGMVGSRVGKVIVSPGSSGVVLKGVKTSGLVFPPSDKVTTGNCFYHLSGSITAVSSVVDSNLFVDMIDAPVNVDTSSKGYFKNNYFIRMMIHGASPAIRIIGDSNRASGSNTFLWANLLTTRGDSIDISNQDNISFIGLDAESWNWSRMAKNVAMMKVRDTKKLMVMASNGGDPKHKDGRYFDLEAESAVIIGSRIGPIKKPAIIIRPKLRRLAMINVQDIGLSHINHDQFLFNAFDDGDPEIVLNGNKYSNGLLNDTEASAIQKLLSSTYSPGQQSYRPTYSPISDPAGPDWNKDLRNKRDSTDYIQGLVDSNKIAYIPAGIYYISKSIRLGDGEGIVGAGSDKTAIIATNKDIDIIIGLPNKGNKGLLSFTLRDITLQGGRNGIHHDSNGSGASAVYAHATISHVTFRDMAEAGIYIDGIIGWDNNFIDYVNFYRCAKAAVKQRVSPLWLRGFGPGMTYMDKNVFYHCQVVDSGSGIDLKAGRANNLNAFIGCSFRDNKRSAATLKNNSSTLFAYSEFINNGGNPSIISNKPVFFSNVYFQADVDNVSLIPSSSTCDHCLFVSGGATNVKLVPDNARLFLLNSGLRGVSLGKAESGLLINSGFTGDPQYNNKIVLIRNGKSVLLTQ